MGTWDRIITDNITTSDIPFRSTQNKPKRGLSELRVNDHSSTTIKLQAADGNTEPARKDSSDDTLSKKAASRLIMNPSVVGMAEGSQDSEFPSPTSSCTTSIDEFNDKPNRASAILATLYEATQRHISAQEQEVILNHLTANPLDLATTSFPFEPEEFASLASNSKGLAMELAQIGYFKTSNKTMANNLTNNLTRLPITLDNLEVITSVVVDSPGKDYQLLPANEKHFLLHNFLSTSLRILEEPSDIYSQQARAQHRQAIAGKVKLLCLFLRNLVVKSVIAANPDPVEVEAMGDYGFEMQELGLRFGWVKDAKKLWELYQAAVAGKAVKEMGALSDVD